VRPNSTMTPHRTDTLVRVSVSIEVPILKKSGKNEKKKKRKKNLQIRKWAKEGRPGIGLHRGLFAGTLPLHQSM